MEIALRRLHQQHIASNTFKTPVDVVQWMGAVQAQDYLGSLWAIGLRMQNATQNGVERAIAGRTIIRTWPLRGTLHFVAAADVRWMLALLTPRFIAKSRSRFKQLDLDERVLACCKELFVNALSGGRQLSRESMHNVLEAARISAANSRGLHILGRLAQEAIICFGPRQGKQQTFVLLEEWVPAAKKMERNEALAELAARYFTSHGPATLHDFAWWSGLTMSDAIAGLEMAKRTLEQEAIGTQAFWFCPPALQSIAREREAYLLPAYDEFTVG